jgi:hypothetical protein
MRSRPIDLNGGMSRSLFLQKSFGEGVSGCKILFVHLSTDVPSDLALLVDYAWFGQLCAWETVDVSGQKC